MAVEMFVVFEPTEGTGMPIPKGEVPDSAYGKLNAIVIQDFVHGVENKATIGSATGSATGSAGGGKAIFNEFTIKKNVDTASDDLYAICTAGHHFKRVTLYIRKGGAPAANDKDMLDAYVSFTFATAFITKIEWAGSAGDEQPVEKVTFAYGAERLAYRQQEPDGSYKKPSQVWWNQMTNNNKEPT